MSDFDLDIVAGGEILIYINLCKGWKNLVHACSINNNYKKSLEDYANEIANFSGLKKARLGWDDEWGLTCAEAHYGDACALLLDKYHEQYYPHNIDTPEQAFTLMATVLKYIHDVRITNSTSNDLPLNWDIWPIEISGSDYEREFQELWIKINLSTNLKEIIKNSNSSEKFKKFIEDSAPFSKQDYAKLKEVRFHWDNEIGLQAVQALPSAGSGEGLNIEKDIEGNFYYSAHNVKHPIQAVALVGSVSKYMQYLKFAEKEKLK